MENKNTPTGPKPKYWKSIRDYYNDPAILEAKAHEFAQGVTDDFKVSEMSGVSRKQFLTLMAASAAFTAAGCNMYKDRGEIIPYNKRPETITPGLANHYASTITGCRNGCGVLVKTREGRPIKLDGNPEHPLNRGKICVQCQASVLNLYDPERVSEPYKLIPSKKAGKGSQKSKVKWGDVDTQVLAALKKAVQENKEIALVMHKTQSPTTKKVLDDFIAAYPTTKVYAYETVNSNQRDSAWEAMYGTPSYPVIKWENAQIILSLDSDFLGNEGHVVEQIRKYAQNRDVIETEMFNRLYVVEAGMSLTGMAADYRMRLRPDAQYEFVLSLLNEVLKSNTSSLSVDSRVAQMVSAYSLEEFVTKHHLSQETVEYLVSDLLANKGKAVVHAGEQLPVSIHMAVNLLNEVLGNNQLYDHKALPINHQVLTTTQEWEALVGNMSRSQVAVVIHLESNPVYHLPPDLRYAEALNGVSLILTMDQMETETAQTSHYLLPTHHDLESWGDYTQRTGVYSIQQPVIAPLYPSRQKEAALLAWAGMDATGYQEDIYHRYLKNRWQKEVYPSGQLMVDFKTFWQTALHDGFWEYDTPAKDLGSLKQDTLLTASPVTVTEDFLVQLKNNYTVGDGKFSNNGWMQELPHPVTKVVWDNYAAISPATAKALNVDTNHKVEVTVNGQKQTLPVYVQPGMADKVVAIELGYGRQAGGTVATGVGIDAYAFMSKESSISPWIMPATVSKAKGKHELVSSQQHHSLADEKLVKINDLHLKRKIIHEANYLEYKKDPKSAEAHLHKPINVTNMHEYPDNKWEMVIDLNKCIGCSACVMSCNVENNVPVVGKEQVKRSREMHWIRIDRYYSGTPDEPITSTQAMLCQHCDNAPCEIVCPVNATNHSPDGINQMAYNRCVGTRYCSNNCPYKVRRFNFFDFRYEFANGHYRGQSTDLGRNPEVTVRSRGVMEKCSFCVQRIMEARQEALKEKRKVQTSDVVTACQQACPSEAIIFGDRNEEGTKLEKYKKHVTAYHVLQDLNARPAITYLGKLRNTYKKKSSTHHA